jgi:hypothetical protein
MIVVDDTLGALRKENAQLAQITRRLPAVHQIGERISVELTLELARRYAAFDTLEALLDRFSNVDPALLHLTGGDRFPAGELHVVPS